MSMSERDARGPEEHERHRSGALPAEELAALGTQQFRVEYFAPGSKVLS
jgi:hypothetical protein